MNRQEAQRRGREAEAIMLAGGFIEARAEHFGPWWRVYGVLPGDNEHVGTTAHQGDPQDPSDLARRLVALAAAKATPPAAVEFAEIPEAAPTDEPTFPAETPATPDEPLTEFSHETSGESEPDKPAERDYAEAAAATDFADDPPEPIDADFTELDVLEPEALGDDFTGALLEGADLGAEVLEENEPSGAFIFGDNLAHDRIVRIGQLAVRASVLIDVAKASYDEAEHNAVRSHVVTNMNEAGAYTGGDQARFNRFIALEAVVAQVRSIEQFRDAQQDYIRNAMHEAVAAFDPEAGWPA